MIDVTNRDKLVLAFGIAGGVLITGLLLEGVAAYAAMKREQMSNQPNEELVKVGREYLNGILRGSGDASTSDAASSGSGDGPSAVPASPLARSTSTSADVLEPAYTNNGVPEEFRISE